LDKRLFYGVTNGQLIENIRVRLAEIGYHERITNHMLYDLAGNNARLVYFVCPYRFIATFFYGRPDDMP